MANLVAFDKDAYIDACPVCGSDSCENPAHVPPGSPTRKSSSPEKEETRYRIEDLHAFAERLKNAPEIGMLIAGLVPEEGIALWHGQPRDFKSLGAMAATLDLTSDRNVFGNPRFKVKPGAIVAYFTEEDSERLFYARYRWLTARQSPPARGRFFPFIRRALTFDSQLDRDFILSAIDKTHSTLAVFDPLRSYTSLCDKGPADFSPVIRFLRQIQNETACKAILIPHHDVKPILANTRNPERTRSQNASGGGIFSIADCPASFRKIAWNRVAIFPEDYKMSGDPKPFEVTFETDERRNENGAPCFGSWVRAVAKTKDERDIGADADRDHVLDYLRKLADDAGDHLPGRWVTTREVEQGARLRNGTAGRILEQLRAAGLVAYAEKAEAKALGRNLNARLCSLSPACPELVGDRPGEGGGCLSPVHIGTDNTQHSPKHQEKGASPEVCPGQTERILPAKERSVC